MIRVVNLSPAIDVTYELEALVPGESLRVRNILRTPGGKGVNVARVIHAGGEEVELVLPLGGKSGAWISEQLSEIGIKTKEVPIAAETRTCVGVVAAETTVLNEPAAPLLPDEVEAIINALETRVAVTVLSGSLPASLSESQLKRLFSTLRNSSEKLLVDTSGKALLLAAEIGADLVKPNRAEALAATESASIEGAVGELLSRGADSVLLSDGEQGAFLTKPNRVLRARGRKVSGNPTGAGDAMVALAAIGLEKNLSDVLLLRRSVAAGQLAVTEPVAGAIDWSQLETVANSVGIEE